MLAIDHFPVPVIAAIRGYCMGGGMDLALACDYRIAAPNAVFGHRGASLGVMTGWGGTQRLPRLIGKARAMQMFLLAEMVKADEALRIGLVDAIADDPIAHALRCCRGLDDNGRRDVACYVSTWIHSVWDLSAHGSLTCIEEQRAWNEFTNRITIPDARNSHRFSCGINCGGYERCRRRRLICIGSGTDLSSGIPSVSANMSSTIALYPGSLTSGWAYRKNFQPILNVSVKAMFLATLAGGFVGAILLLLTPSSAFDKIIPWLLLVGSLAFALGPWLGHRLHRYWPAEHRLSDRSAVSSGSIWRLLWRRRGDHDDGGLECAGPNRYPGDERR